MTPMPYILIHTFGLCLVEFQSSRIGFGDGVGLGFNLSWIGVGF